MKLKFESKQTIEKPVIFLLLLVLGLFAVLSYSSFLYSRESRSTSDWVNQTHALISEADAIVSSLHAGEALLKSFLITADERDRAGSRMAYADAAEHLDLARAMTRDDPPRHDSLAKVASLLEKRVEFFQKTVRALPAGADEVRKLMKTDSADTDQLEIQKVVEALKVHEMGLLQERDKKSYLQAQRLKWIIGTGVVLQLLTLGFMLYLVFNELSTRRHAAMALTDANQKLEQTVQERTSQLVDANKKLADEILEQKWSNQALEHQLRYNQLIINSIGDLVLVASRASNILRVNTAVLNYTGMESHELVAGPVSRILQIPNDAGAADGNLPAIAAALRDGRDLLHKPALLRNREGTQSRAELNVFPLRDGDKVVGGVIIIQLGEKEAPHGGSELTNSKV